jgi:hypothetical protein
MTPVPLPPCGAQPGDPWFARLAFHLLQKVGPGWLTVWLVLILGGLVALAVVAGPWVPGAITVVSGLAAGGTAVAKRIGQAPSEAGPGARPAAVERRN